MTGPLGFLERRRGAGGGAPRRRDVLPGCRRVPGSALLPRVGPRDPGAPGSALACTSGARVCGRCVAAALRPAGGFLFRGRVSWGDGPRSCILCGEGLVPSGTMTASAPTVAGRSDVPGALLWQRKREPARPSSTHLYVPLAVALERGRAR